MSLEGEHGDGEFGDGNTEGCYDSGDGLAQLVKLGEILDMHLPKQPKKNCKNCSTGC